MRYWTLFPMRMLARVGLATAVTLWVASQWGPNHFVQDIGAIRFKGTTDHGAVAVWWGLKAIRVIDYSVVTFPQIPLNQQCSDLSVPGLSGCGPCTLGAVQLDYWLPCLTFLTATVVTSWRWKSKEVRVEGLTETESSPRQRQPQSSLL